MLTRSRVMCFDANGLLALQKMTIESILQPVPLQTVWENMILYTIFLLTEILLFNNNWWYKPKGSVYDNICCFKNTS